MIEIQPGSFVNLRSARRLGLVARQPRRSCKLKLRTPRRCAVLHAWVNVETHELVLQAAEREGVHPDKLVAALLVRIFGPHGR